MQTNNQPARVLFLLGIGDNKTVEAFGYGPKGNILYEWDGNTDFFTYLRLPAQFKQRIYVLWFDNMKHAINRPDIIVNCVADADMMSKSLVNVRQMVDSMVRQWPGVQVYNQPAAIPGTRRDEIYNRFKGLPGLTLPKTIRFRPTGVDDVLRTVKKENLNFPFIMRRCGTHRGQSMLLVESLEQRQLLEQFAYDGGDYYLIEFHDFKNADGFYAKSRLICMDDRLYPRHYLFSDHWNVHASARERLMADNEALQKQEKHFLENYESIIRPEALLSLKKIYRQCGLDYLGFDYAVQPDGSLLIFEINAAQNAMAKSDFDKFPYLKKYNTALINAFNQQIVDRLSGQERIAAHA